MGYYDATGTWREGDANYGYDSSYTGASSNPYLNATTTQNTGATQGAVWNPSPEQLAYGYTLQNALMQGGIAQPQAAGQAGSAFTETGGFATGVQGAFRDGQEVNAQGPGRGIYQWEVTNNLANGYQYPQSSARGDAFRQYMVETGLGQNPDGTFNYLDPQANAGFALREQQSPQFSGSSWLTPQYLAANDPQTAAQAFTTGYLRPGATNPHMAQRMGAASAINDYYGQPGQGFQNPGYQSGNYYGDYSGGGYSYPDPQLNNGANYGYDYAQVGNSNPYLDQFSNAINTGQLNTSYNKGGSTGPQYVTDSGGITRAVQSYGNNEYGYGGGYDPQAYGYGGTNYSTGYPQNATTAIQNAQYMNYSGQPDITVYGNDPWGNYSGGSMGVADGGYGNMGSEGGIAGGGTVGASDGGFTFGIGNQYFNQSQQMMQNQYDYSQQVQQQNQQQLNSTIYGLNPSLNSGTNFGGGSYNSLMGW
jgi:hypothetical protein